MNRSARFFSIALFLAWTAPAAFGQAPPDVSGKRFDGPFVTAGLGSQNVIAGSLVGGRDVLASDLRSVTELGLGWRRQLASGFVLGVEVAFGGFDGTLDQIDDLTGARIRYEGDRQLTLGGLVGRTVGTRRRTLVAAYVAETERDFDVAIELGPDRFVQRDEQGLLRYGLSVEVALASGWSVRAAVGTTRADFGSTETNFDPDGEVEWAAGVRYSF